MERQFTFLPGAFGGLGLYANYTYTRSSRKFEEQFFSGGDVVIVPVETEFEGQPEHSGSVAITYNKYNIDAALAYTTQARRLSFYQAHNLSKYNESDESLDLRAEYRFEVGSGDYSVYFEALDLLKGSKDPDVERSFGGVGTTPKYYSDGNFFGGRVFNLGFRATF